MSNATAWSLVHRKGRQGRPRYRSVVNLRPSKAKLFSLPPLLFPSLNLLQHRPSSLHSNR